MGFHLHICRPYYVTFFSLTLTVKIHHIRHVSQMVYVHGVMTLSGQTEAAEPLLDPTDSVTEIYIKNVKTYSL